MGELVWIGLGTNQGERKENLLKAVKMIEEEGGQVCRQSALYESEPWGMVADQWFLNQVIEIRTSLSPETLLDLLLKIEKEMGRIRSNTEGYESRIIDLDILLWEGKVCDTPRLIIPHPHINKRKFVLLPLAELIPHHIHPHLNETIDALAGTCEDPLKVIKTEL